MTLIDNMLRLRAVRIRRGLLSWGVAIGLFVTVPHVADAKALHLTCLFQDVNHDPPMPPLRIDYRIEDGADATAQVSSTLGSWGARAIKASNRFYVMEDAPGQSVSSLIWMKTATEAQVVRATIANLPKNDASPDRLITVVLSGSCRAESNAATQPTL